MLFKMNISNHSFSSGYQQVLRISYHEKGCGSSENRCKCLKILAYNLQNFSNSVPLFGVSKKNMARNWMTEFEVLQKL